MLDDLDLLKEAARIAGEVATPFWRCDPKTWEKDDGAGPVTEADFAVDAALLSHLMAARPDYGWLSEETADSPARLQRKKVFIIDPIDGTRSFIAGDKNWAHSLAIAEDGDITAAVVYLPLRARLFSAAKGKGAWLNDEVMQSSKRAQVDGATVLTARPTLLAQHWTGGTPKFVRKFRPSLAYRMALVAQGRYDAMISLRATWEWDVAAGCLILSEAGGTAMDRHGNAPRFNRPDPRLDGLVAAGTPLAREIQMRLAVPD